MRATRTNLTIVAGLLVLVLSVAIVVAVFQLRTASGDVYPPYSTFRPDPLGGMAFFNALDSMDGVSAQRFMREFNELPEGRGATLFIHGASISPDPVDVLESVESFAYQGGRVVIAYHPLKSTFPLTYLRETLRQRDEQERALRGERGKKKKEADENEEQDSGAPQASEPDSEGDSPAPDTTEGEPAPEPLAEEESNSSDEDGEESDASPLIDPKILDISERWNFSYGFEDPYEGFQSTPQDSSRTLEPEVIWHSGLYFHDLDDHWTPVYVRDSGEDSTLWATVMERKMGSGSIVLCSDSYFLSNEALRDHRASTFLMWLTEAGPRSTMLFSETHLGTQERDRIMTLVRRYRLHGLFFGLLLLGLLFVWRNATSLVPRVERAHALAGQRTSAAQRSHQDGLDNLLARFVPPEQLLDTCIDEWLQQFQNSPKAPAVRALRGSIVQKKSGTMVDREEVVAAYNRLAAEVHKH